MTVAELLSDESKWTKGKSGRDRRARACLPNAPWAVCWCLAGAVSKAGVGSGVGYKFRNARDRLNKAATQKFPERIAGDDERYINFNDHPETTYSDVMAVVHLAGV